MRKLIAISALALAACGAPQTAPAPEAPAAEAAAAGIAVRDAWASPTPGGVDVSAGYLTIANGGDAEDRLIGATSPRAAEVQIHIMQMDGGVMSMHRADGVIVPARGEATLAPHGTHLMFMGVTQPFAAGEEIPVQLTFEHAGAVDVTLPVRAP